jgi:hypothetical protein
LAAFLALVKGLHYCLPDVNNYTRIKLKYQLFMHIILIILRLLQKKHLTAIAVKMYISVILFIAVTNQPARLMLRGFFIA